MPQRLFLHRFLMGSKRQLPSIGAGSLYHCTFRNLVNFHSGQVKPESRKRKDSIGIDVRKLFKTWIFTQLSIVLYSSVGEV